MGHIHFLNGTFVPDEALLISPRDLGFSRGYAVHDFIVTYNNKPFKLAEHIERLFRSAEIIGLQIPWSKTQIREWVMQTLEKNDKDAEKTIKIFLSGGISNSMRQAKTPTIAIMISPRMFKPTSDYENGIQVKAVLYQRPYPEAKTNFYIEGVKQISLAENNDIAEILYFDNKQVFEGAGSNIFAVIDNKLVTTKSNIVEGITRNTLLEILQLSIPIAVDDFTFGQLENATEVFLTGSNSEVRGVVEINGRPVGDGNVGEITKEVIRQYRAYILQIKKPLVRI